MSTTTVSSGPAVLNDSQAPSHLEPETLKPSFPLNSSDNLCRIVVSNRNAADTERENLWNGPASLSANVFENAERLSQNAPMPTGALLWSQFLLRTPQLKSLATETQQPSAEVPHAVSSTRRVEQPQLHHPQQTPLPLQFSPTLSSIMEYDPPVDSSLSSSYHGSLACVVGPTAGKECLCKLGSSPKDPAAFSSPRSNGKLQLPTVWVRTELVSLRRPRGTSILEKSLGLLLHS